MPKHERCVSSSPKQHWPLLVSMLLQRRRTRGKAENARRFPRQLAAAFSMSSPLTNQTVAPLRSPGFPVEPGGAGAFPAPFPCRKAHTRPCPVQRGRKSGYAPVGMKIHLGNDAWRSQTKLSSRPERSVVEGSAVRPSGFPNFGVLTHTLKARYYFHRNYVQIL